MAVDNSIARVVLGKYYCNVQEPRTCNVVQTLVDSHRVLDMVLIRLIYRGPRSLTVFSFPAKRNWPGPLSPPTVTKTRISFGRIE